jgi:hypothetical protein
MKFKRFLQGGSTASIHCVRRRPDPAAEFKTCSEKAGCQAAHLEKGHLFDSDLLTLQISLS